MCFLNKCTRDTAIHLFLLCVLGLGIEQSKNYMEFSYHGFYISKEIENKTNFIETLM